MGYLSENFNNEGVPFMEGRKKGSIMGQLLGSELHINDYGFINGSKGEYAVLSFTGIDGLFFFGNKIITEDLKQMQLDLGSKEKVIELFKNGSVTFERRMNKKGTDEYIAPIYKD